MTELKEARLKTGVSATDLAKEMGISTTIVSLHENGHRKYKGDRYEQFYYDWQQALTRILKRRGKGRTVDTRREVDTEGNVEVVHYNLINEEVLKKAAKMIKRYGTIRRVAIELFVHEETLEKKMKENNLI